MTGNAIYDLWKLHDVTSWNYGSYMSFMCYNVSNKITISGVISELYTIFLNGRQMIPYPIYFFYCGFSDKCGVNRYLFEVKKIHTNMFKVEKQYCSPYLNYHMKYMKIVGKEIPHIFSYIVVLSKKKCFMCLLEKVSRKTLHLSSSVKLKNNPGRICLLQRTCKYQPRTEGIRFFARYHNREWYW